MANALRTSSVVPAQLGFLAIYNPSLGTTDETVDDQIVYYASASTLSNAKERRRLLRAAKDGRPTDSISSEERNERLRQIGLAQGMVEFARSFSGGKAVDSIDTERARVVLHELEPGWWILASIDLTRLPLSPSKTPDTPPTSSPPPAQTRGTAPEQTRPPEYEYSAREVKPPALLLRDLLRAHALFLLHHGPSLSALYSALPRPQFGVALARYWDSFLLTWNVLLHGNPARDVLGGIKVAASGELGMGVGEEDRGSGEREVLEGMAGGAVAGLVDLVVGRFGDAGAAEKEGTRTRHAGGAGSGGSEHERWLGQGTDVGAEDGAVFLGVGALSRRSLRAVTDWMEDVYTWGESAYGVSDGLAAAGSRVKRRRRGERSGGVAKASPSGVGRKTQKKGKDEPGEPETGGDTSKEDRNDHTKTSAEGGEAAGGVDKMLSYLKFGYGTYWSLGTTSPASNSDAGDESAADSAAAEDALGRESTRTLDDGYFLLGLEEPKADPEQSDRSLQGGPATPRTVTVELEAEVSRQRNPNNDGSSDPDTRHASQPRTAQLRPVIYIHRPFIYILLFQPTGSVLPSWEKLSRSLHSQLTTLHKPLLSSTAYRPEKPLPASLQSEIYDLVFDPKTLTIHSTIPNIPDPVFVADSTPGGLLGPSPPPPPPPKSPPTTAPWTRVEALSTHNQILNMFAGSRGEAGALERTCKTSRGWWVVWSRVLEQGQTAGADRRSPSPGGSDSGQEGANDGDGSECDSGPGVGKEIFLVRRASDQGAGVRSVGAASYVGGGASAGWAEGASRLAQGIGVDTRRYIEGLLSLNR
ncbi:uncharacterized protein P884DRAFT_286255 [Thermothelomyces heterothallicus CBS 202.75]|uniref:uncharacterized protein n=1 Tax=Thermothelomyces heterothallicus CBS 202.75 TaxID=1149848 RepID=UPI0037432721